MSDFIPTPAGGLVSIELEGVSSLRAKLGKLNASLDDFEPLWDDLTRIMEQHITFWFQSEGEGTWPELTPGYAGAKAAAGYGQEMLIREGDLLESLLDPSRAKRVEQGRSSIGTFSSYTFSWGTEDPTAEYHTEGRDGPTVMPPRPPLVLTAGLRTEVRYAAEEWLDDVVRRSGLEAE